MNQDHIAVLHRDRHVEIGISRVNALNIRSAPILPNDL
jgi:hypothetical protein